MAATREFSAGGILVRKGTGGWDLAVITPRGRHAVALPKGHIDPGETPAQTAVREVREETGLLGKPIEKLGDVKYVYRFRGRTIFKEVSFFLLEWVEGEINVLDAKMRVEVDKAFWIALSAAEEKLSYAGEREMARNAVALLAKHSQPTNSQGV